MPEKTNQEHIAELEEMLAETKLDAVTDEVIEQTNVVAEEVAEINESTSQTLANIEQREADLFQKEVSFTLKSAGLEMFEGIINVKDAAELDITKNKLIQIMNDIKVQAGFIPKDVAKQDAVSVAEQNKDVKGMLGAKFSKLFK